MTESILKVARIKIGSDNDFQVIDPANYGIDEKLPYDHDSYFTRPEGTVLIELSQRQPMQAREQGGRNALINMKEARVGAKAKRPNHGSRNN